MMLWDAVTAGSAWAHKETSMQGMSQMETWAGPSATPNTAKKTQNITAGKGMCQNTPTSGSCSSLPKPLAAGR